MKLALLSVAGVLCACGSAGRDFQSNDDAGWNARDAGADAQSPGADASTPPPTTDAQAPKSPKLEIVSGNGGTVASGWPASDPLRVRALDGQGNPVAGASVAFAVGAGQSLHLQITGATVTTDADGIASVTYNAFPIQSFVGYEADTVTASWNGAQAAFGVIITQVPSGTWAAPPLFDVKKPDTSPYLGTLKAGTTVPGGIQAVAVFQQGPSTGQGVPGWGLRLTSQSDLLQPADIGCAGGTAIADAKGNLSCDLVVPSQPGDYYFSMLAGGAIRWDGHVSVVP
jgi:hypothetical protein